MSRIGRALALAVAASLGLPACGVPLDEEPRVIEDGSVADPEGTAAQPAPAGGASSPKVFFLASTGSQGQERLAGVSRDVAAQPKPVLTELFKGLTPEERDQRLKTSIPADTRLIDTNLEPDGTLAVDVSEEFFDAKGEAQQAAVAQLVYTATTLRQVRQVRLLVDGQPRDWPRGDGVVVATPLTPFDYPDLNPSSQPDYPPAAPPVPPPSTVPPTSAQPAADR
jgi:hypothetical protein